MKPTRTNIVLFAILYVVLVALNVAHASPIWPSPDPTGACTYYGYWHWGPWGVPYIAWVCQ